MGLFLSIKGLISVHLRAILALFLFSFRFKVGHSSTPCNRRVLLNDCNGIVNLAARGLAKDFEASIASAKAWVYIASVQLLIRRLA